MVVSTNKYVPRGAYIGQSFAQVGGVDVDFPRYVGIVAKTLDKKLFRNAGIRRGFIEGETLPFNSSTYIALLSVPAIPEKAAATLLMSSGLPVEDIRWDFLESTAGSGVWDAIQIDPQVFDGNETYTFDFQSNSSTVLDIVPVTDLREVLSVGNNEDQSFFVEGQDFIFNTTTGTLSPNAGNGVSTSSVSAVKRPVAVGTMSATVVGTFTHAYSRDYSLEVTGVAPLVATISAIHTSGGSGTVVDRTISLQNDIAINTAADGTFALEHGLSLALVGVANATIGDTYTFSAFGAGLLELHDANLNTNQFAEVDAIVADGANTGAGSLEINPQSVFAGTENANYEFEVMSIAGASGNFQIGLRWRSSGSKSHTSTLMSSVLEAGVTTRILVEEGIFIDVSFGATNFVVGDKFTTTARVAKNQYGGKLDQTYTFTCNGSDGTAATASFTYFSSEPSGGFGNHVFTDLVSLSLANNLRVYARNLKSTVPTNSFSGTAAALGAPVGGVIPVSGLTGMSSANVGESIEISGAADALNNGIFPISNVIDANNVEITSQTAIGSDANNAALSWVVGSLEKHVTNDQHAFTVSFNNTFDWTPRKSLVETISSSEIARDVTGTITGTVGSYFVRTQETPLTISYAKNATTNVNLTFNQVADTNVIYFSASPTANVELRYEHAGNEPAAGGVYFLSGYVKRPQSDYDSPTLLRSRDEATEFFAPLTLDNDAAIANEIAWDQNQSELPGVVAILVQDIDGDGVFTSADYRRALSVGEKNALPTDIVVLNSWNTRLDQKNSDINMNDPLVRKHRITYLAPPRGTPIGDEFTAGSRISVAKNEMHIAAATPAKGTIVMIAQSWCKKTLTLSNNRSVQVTLDGCFLAVALAARVASFSQPQSAILGVPLAGFDEIEFLDEAQLNQVQAARMIGILVNGALAEYNESTTLDSTEPSTAELSGTTQRQYVIRRLQSVIEKSMASAAPASQEAGVLSLKSSIVVEMAVMASTGVIAPYTDAGGSPRQISPDDDVEVVRGANATDYYFKTWWNQFYPQKRAFGLVSVDKKLFGGNQ